MRYVAILTLVVVFMATATPTPGLIKPIIIDPAGGGGSDSSACYACAYTVPSDGTPGIEKCGTVSGPAGMTGCAVINGICTLSGTGCF